MYVLAYLLPVEAEWGRFVEQFFAMLLVFLGLPFVAKRYACHQVAAGRKVHRCSAMDFSELFSAMMTNTFVFYGLLAWLVGAFAVSYYRFGLRAVALWGVLFSAIAVYAVLVALGSFLYAHRHGHHVSFPLSCMR